MWIDVLWWIMNYFNFTENKSKLKGGIFLDKNINDDLLVGLEEEEDDDDSNKRDKDLENKIKEIAKKRLSKRTVDFVNENDEEMDKIIKDLRKRGVETEGQGIDLSKKITKKVSRVRSL